MEFNLKPATESDRTYIRRLHYLADVFGDESKPLGCGQEKVKAFVDDWSPEHDGGWIAHDQERTPAGGIWLRYWEEGDTTSEANLGPDIPELILAVEERSHGYGLSAVLLHSVCELAIDQGAKRIALEVMPENKRARYVYEKFGFIPTEANPNVMYRDLA